MTHGERELREFLAQKVALPESVVACAYGVEQQTRAERLGGLLGASMGSWIGGALALDAGWGLATTPSRLLAVPVARVQRLLKGYKLRFGRVQSFADPRELGARFERRERERERALRLTLERREVTLVFGDVPGFPSNVEQADALAAWLNARG